MINILKKTALLCFFCLSVMTIPVNVFAQQGRTITGVVTDTQQEPLIGASVVIHNTTKGSVTDVNGRYSIQATGDVKLKVVYLGYQTKLVNVSVRETKVDISLEEDVMQLEDLVVVGYSTQKRANIAGSVAVIGNEKLVTTKNQNVQNMLTGKLPGVRVIQKTAEPGNLENVFDIRGFGTPLIIVDGSSISMAEFQRIDPNDIESISILKDASAAIYGVRSSNGVVLIQTKKGSEGKSHIEYSMYYGIQNPSELLKPVNAYDRAVLVNEKFRRENPTATELSYSAEDLAKLKSGATKSYDWYDAVIRQAAPQQQHNLSMNGGTEKLNYYLNFGYLNQESIFKSGDMNYSRYNLRSNINIQAMKDLMVGIRISGAMDDRNRPQQDAWGVFKSLWRTPTTLNIYANDNPAYYQQIPGQDNALALTNSDLTGYKIDKKKIINTSFDAVYTVPYVKGLTAKALFSYDNTMEDNTNFLKQYQLYNYSGSGTYDPQTYGRINELTRTANNALRKTWNVSLNYKNTFQETHTLNTSLIYEENYEENAGFRAFRELIMPLPYLDLGSNIQQATGGAPVEYANKGLIGLLNYDYKSRYLFEGSFRYDGSSRFLPGHQWDLFYSGLLAWRISEEALFKDKLSFVNNLKLRASYGRLGDDGANLYEFLGGYNYGTEGSKENSYPRLYDLGTGFVPALTTRATPNFNIGWLEIYTANIGLDMDLWDGLLGLSFDVFQRTREGLYATRASNLPETFGSSMPQENLNSDQAKGLEIELRHHNTLGELRYNLSANFSITRTMTLTNVHTPYGNSYDEWKNTNSNRYANVWFLYGKGARLQSYEERATYPYLIAQNILPGDYILQDWNNDGVVDDNDKFPAAIKGDSNGNSRPYANFAFSANFAYKGFDLDCMLQGSALGYVVYGEQLSQPLVWNGNALPYFLDRWHPEDPMANPNDPTTKWEEGRYLYGAIGFNSESLYGVQNGAYLRLKNLTVGYTLPKTLLKKGTNGAIEHVRVYLNGYNLYTFTGVIGLDPERPNDQSGSVYPINRTVNLGVQIKF